jgi:uncharacterized protein YqfA (UPF0365 family)
MIFTIAIIAVAIVAVMTFFYFVPVGLWITALAADVDVSIPMLVGMRLRNVPPGRIVDALIKANKAGPRGQREPA